MLATRTRRWFRSMEAPKLGPGRARRKGLDGRGGRRAVRPARTCLTSGRVDHFMGRGPEDGWGASNRPADRQLPYRLPSRGGGDGGGLPGRAPDHRPQAWRSRCCAPSWRDDTGGSRGSSTRRARRTPSATRNIIEIFDFGTLPDGTPYIMMELLEGESLAPALAARRPLSRSTTPSIAHRRRRRRSRAAHAQGHRPPRPQARQHLPRRPSDDAPGDRAWSRCSTSASRSCAEHASGGVGADAGPASLMGTPLYMSPEQCRGTEEVDSPHRHLRAGPASCTRCCAGRRRSWPRGSARSSPRT